MGFIDWLKTRYKIDKDLKRHDSRYHGGRFDPALMRCALRDAADKRDRIDGQIPVPNGDVGYYDRIKAGTTAEEAERRLQEEFGVEGLTRKAALKRLKDASVKTILAGLTVPVSQKAHEDTIRSVYAVLYDLKTRFPYFMLTEGGFKLVPAHICEKNTGGLSTPDTRKTEEPVMIINSDINPDEFVLEGYGHLDRRLPYDIIRHELGHIMSIQSVIECFWGKERSEIKEIGEIEYFDIVADKVSQYAQKYRNSQDDRVAEIFSKATSPDYRQGEMPKWFEEFILTNMLNGR